MTRAAIYIRVSSEDQAAKGFSIPAQEERLRAYSKARDWEVGDVFIDDGFTGRDTKRPEYQRMMTEIFGYDTILVWRTDRIHRNLINFIAMLKQLKEWGKGFCSATESLDTETSMGRFVADMICRIAQLESEQLAERVFFGMEKKARMGVGALGSNHPLGYAIRGGQYHVVRDEARTVERVFGLVLQGKTLAQIADHLNKKGSTTKKGTQWTAVKLFRIVHNPVYAGFIRWNGTTAKAPHKGIVSEETFKQAQSALRARRPTDLR